MTRSAGGDAVLHVIVPQREGAIGGADLHVLDLAVAQQRDRGWRPVILAPRAPQGYLDRLGEAGLRVANVRTFSGLKSVIRRHGVSLVHAHGYEANYLVAVLRVAFPSWSRLPVVVTAHGWIETTPWLRFKSAMDRVCSRTADVRIATAGAHVAGLRFGRGVAVVIHNGVPPPDSKRLARLRADREGALSRFSVGPGSAVVGFVGRLSPEKRGDLFLSAACRLSSLRPNMHFVVIGGGEQRVELKALAARLGIQDRVTFTGLLNDMTPAYAALDILVQPSDTEGTPRTILEAMAHRVPVVATDVGDVADLLDNGTAGAITTPGDAEGIAREVGRLLDQPSEAAAQAERAYERYCNQFTIQVMRQRIAAAYAQAIQLAEARSTH